MSSFRHCFYRGSGFYSGGRMTVGELINELSNYDENHEIVVSISGEVQILNIRETYLEELSEDDDPTSTVSVVISV